MEIAIFYTLFLTLSAVHYGYAACQTGDIRISEGTPEDGFLEYCLNGNWGIVCGNNWDNSDAEVACRQLGYQPSDVSGERVYVGRPDAAAMYLSRINCNGNEAQLSTCPYLHGGGPTNGIVWHGKVYCRWSNYNSATGLWNYQLAKVHCRSAADDCQTGDIRISEGTPQDGFLEYCVNGNWGIVCGDNWDNSDAEVACRQLGYQPSDVSGERVYVGRPDAAAMYLSYINCNGNEAQLSTCPYLNGGGPTNGIVWHGKVYCRWSTYNSAISLWNYQLAKVHCGSDIVECTSDANDCDANAVCINTPGSYTCKCKNGYDGDGKSCTDIVECTSDANDCHTNAVCINTPGSYLCRCKNGYEGNGKSCTDIVECTSNANDCHANAVCINTPGSYLCRCKDGYEGNGKSCTDIVECTSDANDCHANAVCINTPGSYLCRCKNGYEGNGKSCTDIVECTSDANDCHANAVCINTPGSYTCKCKKGYNGNGKSCTDVNECATGEHNCPGACINIPGSYICAGGKQE